MNYLAKMMVLALLLTLLGKYKGKPEMKLWFMWKNYFLKLWIWKDIKKAKEKLQYKCSILPQKST